MQPVRALWKHGGDASAPAGTSLGILQDEGAVAHQRLDSCPWAPGRDARPQVLPRFAAPRLIAPGLRKYGAPTQHPAACTLSLSGALLLDTMHAVAELGEHLRGGAELTRDGQRHFQLVRHPSLRAEEVQRTPRADRAPVQ